MYRKLTTEEFVLRANIIHNNYFNYELVQYIRTHDKVEIICPTHGIFRQSPATHLKGFGCVKCMGIQMSINRSHTTEEFIIAAKKKHGDKYDYSKTIYGKNAHEKVMIICKEHGEFVQKPANHLNNKGCLLCNHKKSSERHAENPTGWSLENWTKASKKSRKFDSFKIYILKCWNEHEVFYKIGRTFRKTSERFKGKTDIPYNYSIIKEIVGIPEQVYYLEIIFKKINSKFKYIPKKAFKGMYECFSEYNEFTIEELEESLLSKDFSGMCVQENLPKITLVDLASITLQLKNRIVNI